MMGAAYKRIVDNRFPQQAVAGAMDYMLLNIRANMNKLVGVQRNVDNFDRFSKRIDEKMADFKILQSAMVNGHPDVGKEVAGLEGIRIPSCRKGGNGRTYPQVSSAIC